MSRWNIALVAVPALLVGALYAPFAFDAQFFMDDVQLLLRHAHPGDVLGEWTHPTQAFATGSAVADYTWRPLTATLHHLVGEAFGRTPLVYRLLNVVVHAVNTALIVAVATRLGAARVVAAGAALAWGVHPLLADAVCWSCDTYDLLCATFLLVVTGVAFADRRLAVRLGFGTVAFAAALFAKEAAIAFAVSLPVAVALLRTPREALAWLGMLSGVAAGHYLLHATVAGTLEQPGALLSGDFFALWSDYATWMLQPPVGSGLSHLVVRGAVPWSVPGVLIVGCGALLAGAWALRRDPRAGLLTAGGVQWLVLLTPGVAAALLLGLQAGRYTYIPSAVAVVFLAGLLPARRALALVMLGWLALAVPSAAGRALRSRDMLTLALTDAEGEPENPAAAQIAGRELVAHGQVEEGLRLWRFGIENTPTTVRLLDPQQSRIDYVVAAARSAHYGEARDMLATFLAVEAEAGREVSASVRSLEAGLAAAP